MTEPFYVAVKASLHSTDSYVFGLTPEEANALSKRYPGNNIKIMNGILITGNELQLYIKLALHYSAYLLIMNKLFSL